MSVLAAFGRVRHWLALALLAALAQACASPRDEFVAGRVLERCDGQWPVCDQISGCLIGEQSFVEGRFPGQRRLAIQLFEPSTVRVLMFLDQVTAAGTEASFNFFEDRCRSRVRHAVTGRTFYGEAEKQGYVAREADLFGVGDHLLEVESDGRARYLLKLEIVPKRTQVP